MIINKEPKPPELTPIKQKLWEQLQTERDDILSLAYMYAKGYDLCGEDITTRWKNTVLQNDALNRAYVKGYQDGYKAGSKRSE